MKGQERNLRKDVAIMGTSRRRIFIVHGSHYLTDHHFSGDGLVAWGFIRELAKRGHRLHVLTDRLDVQDRVPSNLTLVEFPRVGKNKLLHYMNYARNARAYFERVVAREGIDVAHQMNPVVRGLSLALLGKRVPIVLGTYVGDWAASTTLPEYRVPAIDKRARSVIMAGVDIVQQNFATSLALATPNALARVPLRRLLSNRLEYLHHGVDTNIFTPEANRDDPQPRGMSILYLGSFHRQKGVLDLVDAFGRVAPRITDARIVFVGSGDCLGDMKDKLAALGLLHRAEFPGRASRVQVAGWLRACTALCAPSHGEPYGQNVLEAMATGKPVVITNAGGHAYLSDPRGKIAVAPGNVEELAAALFLVLSDPERATSMGRVNRSIAEQRHSWPRAVDKLEAIYDRAILRNR